MKIGMPTLAEYDSLEQNVNMCSRLGLDFIELNMNLPIFIPENLSSMELLDFKKQYGIEFTIHLPEELDISSFQPSIREGHLQRCKEVMIWAHKADIKLLNMHFNKGIHFTLPDRKIFVNDKYELDFFSLLSKSYYELYELSRSLNISLCIENTGDFHIPFVQRSLEKLSCYEEFLITWDVGHDAKASFMEEDFFLAHVERIKHMHLHDYNGKSDHQALYTGMVPINSRLDFAKKHNLSVVVEVKTSSALEESIKKLRKWR